MNSTFSFFFSGKTLVQTTVLTSIFLLVMRQCSCDLEDEMTVPSPMGLGLPWGRDYCTSPTGPETWVPSQSWRLSKHTSELRYFLTFPTYLVIFSCHAIPGHIRYYAMVHPISWCWPCQAIWSIKNQNLFFRYSLDFHPTDWVPELCIFCLITSPTSRSRSFYLSRSSYFSVVPCLVLQSVTRYIHSGARSLSLQIMK